MRRLSGETSEVVAFCAGLPGPTRVAYEAGPTGFGLARALAAAGVGCVVAAPGKIERPAQDRVKTDRRDAERLRAAADDRRAARGPGPERRGGGAARPRPRARGRARRSDARAPPARASCCCATTCASTAPRGAWTTRHRDWLARVELGERGAQVTLLDYLGAIDALLVRRDTLEATIERARARLAVGARRSRGCAACAASTRSRRSGCAPRSATSSASRAPAQLMSYLGLVPSENSYRRDAPPGRDHQVRLPPRPPAAGRGRLALPPPAAPRAERSSAARPASPRTSSRSPGRPSSACTAPGGASTPSAASAARSSPSPSPASSPASAGRSPTPTDRRPAPRRSRRRRDHPATTRESTRDCAMSTRPGGHARS